MSENLKPCPACGGEALHVGKAWILCASGKCCVTGPTDDPDGSKWNALPRRTGAKAPAGMGDAELIARAIAAHSAMIDNIVREVLYVFDKDLENYDTGTQECIDLDAELARREKERQT